MKGVPKSGCRQRLRLQGEDSPELRETLQDKQVGLAQAPIILLHFPLVPVCVRFYVLLLRVRSYFPQSCETPEAPLAFKAKCSGVLYVFRRSFLVGSGLSHRGLFHR